MANTNKKANMTEREKNLNSINALDTIASKLIQIADSSYSDRAILNTKNAKFQNIIDRQLTISKGVSNGSIIDFIASQRQSDFKKTGKSLDVDSGDLFNKNMNDIFGYFQDIYKNKYLEMADLKFISKFIPAIGEAVKTTLDSIVSSDTISDTISRILVLPASLSDTDKELVIKEIKRFENELKLLSKLKNTVYRKTLVTGQFYVYAISYKELFEQYSAQKAEREKRKTDPMSASDRNGRFKNSSMKNQVNESYNNFDNALDIGMEAIDVDLSGVMEGIKTSFTADNGIKDSNFNEFQKELMSHLSNFYMMESHVPFEDLEDMIAYESFDVSKKYKKSFPFDEIDENYAHIGSDGSYNVKSYKKEKFNVSGTYIKYIDSKNIIPIKILNQVIGYYHIHAVSKKQKINDQGTTSSGILSSATVFSSVNVSQKKKEDAINNIVDTISDTIMRNFNAKFVKVNSKYKKMIADCIITNGLIDNEYRIQFIPAENIVEFKINEDENGYGESILADSLFPAKLLLSLLICKLLNYMNNSGNKTIAHIFKGPIDVSTSNQLNRVIRNIQESKITFNDLLSSNLVFSKFARHTNIAMPMTRSGNHLVEFETQEGQQIDLNTDFENKLEQMAILGTGVPSVLMEYVNQIDYAKQIETANLKYAGRISSLQADLESATTKLYLILIQNSMLSDDLKTALSQSFMFKLPRPQVLANTNNSDQLSILYSMAQNISNIMYGENNTDDTLPMKKDAFIKKFITTKCSFLDWDEIQNIVDICEMEFGKESSEQ